MISVIPNQEKIRQSAAHIRRPIYVLNIDYKIFTSIIVSRLENIIPDLIDTDQAGFIPNEDEH